MCAAASGPGKLLLISMLYCVVRNGVMFTGSFDVVVFLLLLAHLLQLETKVSAWCAIRLPGKCKII